MRELGALLRAEFQKARCRPRLFFEGVFGNTVLNYWNGLIDLPYDSKLWLGNGFLISMSDYRESDEIGREEISITLAGEISTLLALAQTQAKHSNTGQLWVGAVDASDNLVGTPYPLFRGNLNAIDLVDNPQQPTITCNYATELKDIDRASEFKLNHATQQMFVSGDLGFEYMEQLSSGWEAYWGKPQKGNNRKRTKNNR